MRISPYGDRALYVDLELDDAPDRATRTLSVSRWLAERMPGVDVATGAGAVVLAGVSPWDDVEPLVREALGAKVAPSPSSRLHVVRAVYDGPDLAAVAEAVGRPVGEVVALHARRDYLVELIGFLPGFGYLGPLASELVVGRRATPRPRVAAGSIGIAGAFTGVYPLASPGGWNLIARALDFVPFDPRREPASLLRPGDRVRFEVARVG